MRIAGVIAFAAACYSPAGYPDCAISCATGACPAGLTCDPAAQLCTSAGGSCSTDAPRTGCVGTTGSIRNYCPPEPIPVMQTLAVDGDGSTDGTNCVDTITQDSGPEICVWAVAETLIVSANLRFTGTRPVVLVALDEVVVHGTLDVSRGGAGTGPALASAVCTTGTAASAQSTPVVSGAAGGGGGGFATAGGMGGQIVNGQATPGGAALMSAPAILRPGCPGGASGSNLANTTKALGGAPGGGIYVLAGRRVTVDGNVLAFGAGGDGTIVSNVGGGGGGSGGMIVLDAPTVTIDPNGHLLAAGGGGGEGCETNASNGGGVQLLAMPTEPAAGGTGTTGSDGGRGSGSVNPAIMNGAPATGISGGGGGGGGDGFVLVYAPTAFVNGGVVAPSPRPM